MTTHDYPGETNAHAQVDAATVSADPRSERLVESPTAETSGSPDTATDHGWERRADEFAANRDPRGGTHSSADQTDPTTSIEGVDLDHDPRSSTRPSSETSLFDGTGLEEFRGRWDSVQAGFVDDPKRCVEQADGLVSAVVEKLSNGFAEARSRLEQQWSRGEDASTEDLRVALKRYREFFDRLLAV
jgi:hypothetical protein